MLFKVFEATPINKLNKTIKELSFLERVLFGFLVFTMTASALWLGLEVNNTLSVEIPAKEGSLTEGIVGTPRFVNPLLAISDADRDLTALVYSGLMKATPEGSLIPDLAKSVDISEDGLIYTFVIRDDATFHDAMPVSADDVIFTITTAQNSAIKSPKRPNWEGVRVEKKDSQTVIFTLPNEFAPFLESTTIGILPRHLWADISPEEFAFSTYNVEAIGTGPFKVNKIKRDKVDIPKSYELEAFKNYALGEPYIRKMKMVFFNNEDSLLKGYVHGTVEAINSISPEKALGLAKSDKRIETYPLPRIFGVFLNQNEAPALTNPEVRKALNYAVDRSKIINEVLLGYGSEITGPLPLGIIDRKEDYDESVFDKDRAKAILEENGWEYDEELGGLVKETSKETFLLSIRLATSNAPELKAIAERIKQDWEEIGAIVDLQFFDIGALNQEVIRPRNYDALLFGQIIGRDLDPFAFWHSSQRNDPGLNIALYTNITVDDLLEEIRTTLDPADREEKYLQFEKEIADDVPAVFVYSPDFIYLMPKKILGMSLGTVTTPSERFLSVHEWHTDTESVWSVFAN